MKNFLGSLVRIDYDGPIQPEPFNAALRSKSLDQACTSASAAMKRAFSLL